MRTLSNACTAVAVISAALLLIMNRPNRIAIIVLLVILAASLAAEFVLQRRLRKQQMKAQEEAPRRTVLATVEKRRTTHRWLMHGGRAGHASAGRDAWFVAFRTSQGEVLEFETPFDVYQSLREGMSGRLSYKGWQFIRFMADSFGREGTRV